MVARCCVLGRLLHCNLKYEILSVQEKGRTTTESIRLLHFLVLIFTPSRRCLLSIGIILIECVVLRI